MAGVHVINLISNLASTRVWYRCPKGQQVCLGSGSGSFGLGEVTFTLGTEAWQTTRQGSRGGPWKKTSSRWSALVY